MEKLNVIITGATGMVGEGVLHECIQHPDVENILIITRKSTGYIHPKIKEIIHTDFSNFTKLKAQLKGYNACLFCLGVTSIGKKEEEYLKLTYNLTTNFAGILAAVNHNMTFCYISGAGTDSTEKGGTMWARVKGKTENELMRLRFKAVYNFRPGFIKPFLPLKPNQTYYKTYKFISWLFPILKLFAPNMVITLKELAAAMINACLKGYSKNILEIKDIKDLARK
jgi:putative NADH-flavin reductase